MTEDAHLLPTQRTLSGRPVVVALDVGAVTAQVRVVSWETGRVLLDQTWSSATWSATPLAYATDWIVLAVEQALEECEYTVRSDLAAVAIGALGCEVRTHCDPLDTSVRSALGVPTVVVNDAELLVPAAGLDSGVGVIVGSSGFAVVTGPGSPLVGCATWAFSDAGSASAIVREAALTVLARASRGDEPDPLRTVLMASMRLRTVEELARVLHWDRQALEWGGHATAVFTAARLGSEDARALIDTNAQAVATLVAQLVARGAPVGNVVVAGDLAPEVPELFAGIRRAILATVPGASVRMLGVPAVEGAVRLAERSLADEGSYR